MSEVALPTHLIARFDPNLYSQRYLAPPTTVQPSYETKSPPPPVLGLLRHDYMLQGDSGSFKQVEVNTIASSFGCLSTRLAGVHSAIAKLEDSRRTVLPNHAIHQIAEGIAAASRLNGGVVVMVVQEGEANSIDQTIIQQAAAERGARVYRMSLSEIASSCSDVAFGDDIYIHMGGKKEKVALFYFRAGYQPQDYNDESDWSTREIIEGSSAIKCPDVYYHLAGAKKVQQMLAGEGVVESVSGVVGAEQLFTGLWGLGDDDEDVVNMAIQDKNGYVLKPQREGGGNNLYKDNMVEALRTMSRVSRLVWWLYLGF